ncbi:MAG: hypothetical protein LBO68_03250, partial [Synergistaceae bacterium]|nr:hypothetical protein [Synergistaceae bacterium]
MALSRNKKTKTSEKHGSGFELIVFFFMSGTIYLIGTLMNSSWTGEQGQAIGEYLRARGGGALIVPLLFLVYLCIAWFAKSRIPRPLGQIFGTLQLYLSTAFILGLFRNAGGELPWVLSQPGKVGNALAQFFLLNLGVLGTIFVAIASLALSAILFGFQFPLRLFHTLAARFVEESTPERKTRWRGARSRKANIEEANIQGNKIKENKIKENKIQENKIQENRIKENKIKDARVDGTRERVKERLPRTKKRMENATSVRTLSQDADDFFRSSEVQASALSGQSTEILESMPIDGLVIVGEELIDSNGYSSSKSESKLEPRLEPRPMPELKTPEREMPEPTIYKTPDKIPDKTPHFEEPMISK